MQPKNAPGILPVNTRFVEARVLRAMLDDGAELAIVDVREELIFSQSHLLHARSVPLSRFEFLIARLVPRLATRIVLCDGGDGGAERAAAILSSAGYTDISILAGGCAAWHDAGYGLLPESMFRARRLASSWSIRAARPVSTRRISHG